MTALSVVVVIPVIGDTVMIGIAEGSVLLLHPEILKL